MKRFQEKIKDLVENPSFEAVEDLSLDPAATLAAYRFTDVTAELMAKWLDQIADLTRQGGIARALAGHRGVGKSHFLSVIGALAEYPELRSQITHSYVSASSERWLRHKFTVVRVERGTRNSLIEEFRAGLARAFVTKEEEWGETPETMLSAASVQNAEPLIILIDSAYKREHRVERDDGATLGAIAIEAKKHKMFIAVALDDDIAGADGVNAAITRAYPIDYLDQEHLYRIVDSFLYQKRSPARSVLRELYQSLRSVVPSFSWSEQRFSALYPIHPVVADVTPAVRMYAQNFAFLPFAAEIGARVMNRPAHSLVALDELFDRVEPELRKSEELSEVFAIYDSLATEAVSQIPVMQRLQAKLILKGLFVLSLDGRGTTARELSAAMLIYDENQPSVAIERINKTLELFAFSAPENAIKLSEEGADTRFALTVRAGASFESDLSDLAKSINPNRVGDIMRHITRAHYTDYKNVEAESEKTTGKSISADFVWRGGKRSGKISWLWVDKEKAESESDGLLDLEELPDWELIICPPAKAENYRQNFKYPTLIWQPAPLKNEEIEVLRRFAVLRSNANELVEKYGEVVLTSEQLHVAKIERIWTRIFREEGRFFDEDREVVFNHESHATPNIREGLSSLFAPIFGSLYPWHPEFERTLEIKDVSALVSEFFGGGDQNAPAVQDLARLFALPLGLVTQRGTHFQPETEDTMRGQSWVREIIALVTAAGNRAVPMAEVQKRLQVAPYGLTREAQLLILAALVAHRRFEFVTRTGEKIGRRSLNLQIIWEEIIGISRSVAALHEAAELTSWAKILTGTEDVNSIDLPEDRDKIRIELGKWLDKWNAAGVSDKFEALPDEAVNTQVWRIAARAQKNFGAVAEAVEATIDDAISLNEGLQRIADAFADSREEFSRNFKELNDFKGFLEVAALRVEVEKYLALADLTKDENIEKRRTELTEMLRDPAVFLDPETGIAFQAAWHEFKTRFIELYVAQHDAVMRSPNLKQSVESLLQSAEWEEFEFLASPAPMQKKFWRKAEHLLRQVRETACRFNSSQILPQQPFCICGFRLGQIAGRQNLSNELLKTMREGRESYRQTLVFLAAPLAQTLMQIAEKEKIPQIAERAKFLAAILSGKQEIPLLSRVDLRVLEQAVNLMPNTLPVQLPMPEYGFLTREQLRKQINRQLDDLPNEPILVNMSKEI